MDKEFNLVSVVRTILKWKWPIIITTALAGVAAALFSLFIMDEYFLSWATFYPTNQAMSDRNTLFNTQASTQVEYFGSKNDVNRVLTISNSLPVINYIIDSFHLVEHYKIDKTKPYWSTKVRKKFDKNYEAIKTENEAVKISLFDTDPQLAAAMVNAIVNRVDEINKAHVIETKKVSRVALQEQIGKDEATLSGYTDTLAYLSERYKIKASQGAQGSVVVEGNDYKAVQVYKTLLAKQTGLTDELTDLENILGQMDVSMKNSETSLYILEPAIPADRREKPVRSLVVLITVIVTFFVCMVGVLIIEEAREIKRQL